MADHDGVDFRRYGLTNGDPFVSRVLDASNTEDRELLLPFSGFPSQARIDAHINRAKDGSTAFLLSGRSATGRTTMANTIIHRYIERMEHPKLFHLVTYREKSHDSKARVHGILKYIRNEVIRSGNWAHRKEIREEVPDGDGQGLSDLDLQAQADYLAYFMDQHAKPKMRVGLLIDGIQDNSFMDTLAVVFANVDTVIVVTRDDYDTPDTASAQRLNERVRWQDWALHIQLPTLRGSDMEMLADNRWKVAAPDVRNPFELDGLRTTFDTRPEPIGVALKWLRWLLQWRLLEYQGTECWPAAEDLGISADWIESRVRAAETAPPADRRR